MATIYYGETLCQATKRNGDPCNNKAYYVGLRCGVHAHDKTGLPVNPNARRLKQDRLKAHSDTVTRAAADNAAAGRQGQLILSKMRMMQLPEYREGFLNIYPNYRHGNRADGRGMPELSPKSIGPIRHGQPGLPDALNLENLHQGSKAFVQEIGPDGLPNETFRQNRIGMYIDPVPHRHKRDKYPDLTAGAIPKYSVWIRPDGTEEQLSYFESRQIYCMFYEKHVAELPAFRELRDLLAKGWNLQICGFDAYPVSHDADLDACYRDTSRPFGHELVLYSMLRGETPWRNYITLSELEGK